MGDTLFSKHHSCKLQCDLVLEIIISMILKLTSASRLIEDSCCWQWLGSFHADYCRHVQLRCFGRMVCRYCACVRRFRIQARLFRDQNISAVGFVIVIRTKTSQKVTSMTTIAEGQMTAAWVTNEEGRSCGVRRMLGWDTPFLSSYLGRMDLHSQIPS
ncbi:hypothetical protein BDZ97DRAFT_297124 [Flammula alnicola]|nr:hypothetical protein BDZ97DRAFT_297124 [Flammula alnicola]